MTANNPLSLPIRLWGDDTSQSSKAPVRGLRNMFREPDPERGEVFRAGGLISPDGLITPENRVALRRMMARLRSRMWRADPEGNLWVEKLAPKSGAAPPRPDWRNFENPSLPSGYTYLLQLIAHDMVDSVIAFSFGAGDIARPEFANARRRPLMLDTLYGDGPDECPHAYVSNDRQRLSGSHPRTRLRVGEIAAAPGGNMCPAQDLTRATPDLGTPAELITDAFAADPRNDAHALMPQLTVLFSILHNAIMGLIETPDNRVPLETTYREFQCARSITTLVYRTIIEHDVLPKILHPAVQMLYASKPHFRLDPQSGVTAEFSAGAFRFGHAMVRDTYRVNDTNEAGLPFIAALGQSSRHGARPNAAWAADWRYFFSDDPNVNLSRRLGPYYTDPLTGPAEFKAKLTTARLQEIAFDHGLAVRDFLSASHAALWSVPKLIEEVRARLRQASAPDLVVDFDVWRQPLSTWLADHAPADDDGSALFATDDITRLSNDPPMPFFILFEAAHAFADTTPLTTLGAGLKFAGQGGRTLGPLGSIIVAETFYGALRSTSAEAGRTGASTFQDRVQHICATMGVDIAKLKTILQEPGGSERRLETMPQLLGLLKELNFGKTA
jgi:Animal haem peroxidase